MAESDFGPQGPTKLFRNIRNINEDFFTTGWKKSLSRYVFISYISLILEPYQPPLITNKCMGSRAQPKGQKGQKIEITLYPPPVQAPLFRRVTALGNTRLGKGGGVNADHVTHWWAIFSFVCVDL